MSCRSDKKIICPYCGAEMEIKTAKYGQGALGWTMCRNENCSAEGPLVSGKTMEKAVKNARTAALRCYTPLLRPMTLEEATSTDEAVWYEHYGNPYTERADCRVLLEVKAYTEICELRQASAWLATTGQYGKTWRCWERKPTDEERSAALWEISPE